MSSSYFEKTFALCHSKLLFLCNVSHMLIKEESWKCVGLPSLLPWLCWLVYPLPLMMPHGAARICSAAAATGGKER